MFINSGSYFLALRKVGHHVNFSPGRFHDQRQRGPSEGVVVVVFFTPAGQLHPLPTCCHHCSLSMARTVKWKRQLTEIIHDRASATGGFVGVDDSMHSMQMSESLFADVGALRDPSPALGGADGYGFLSAMGSNLE